MDYYKIISIIAGSPELILPSKVPVLGQGPQDGEGEEAEVYFCTYKLVFFFDAIG